MSAPWWGKEAGAELHRQAQGGVPRLHPDRADELRRELLARAGAFTSEWSNRRSEDAGIALAKLFAELAEPVLQRLNRLPDKALVEFLRHAGIQTLPPRPARASLAFTVSGAAPQSVLVPEGFQVSASAADGSGETVIFETERSLNAVPAEIAAAFAQQGRIFLELDVSGAGGPWRPLGDTPRPGAALLLGLSATIMPRPSLALGLRLAERAGAPPPVAAGGLGQPPAAAGALLRWEFFDGGAFNSAEVIRDETRSLAQSGMVELRVPAQWRAGTPADVPVADPLRWLRLRLVHGQLDPTPELISLHLNMVPATAVHTIRDEVLEYIPGSDRRRMRLSQTPVLPGSLELLVDEGELALAPGAAEDGRRLWREVDDLLRYGPDDRVYVLDAVNGEVRFGDGVHGAALPPGFRHVSARRYQLASGAAGAVDAEAITTLVQSLPFLTGVVNPAAASGGSDEEALTDTLRRGPQKIRARGRAVTVADYALLALQASGAQVGRAHAVSAQHPGFPGARLPGVVAVFVTSQDRGSEPPVPDQGSLTSVAQHLSQAAAPAGVEVVAAAPPLQRVGIRAAIVARPGADLGELVRRILHELDDYLHPLHGGDDGEGWPFGGAIIYHALLRRLLERAPDLQAVKNLNLVVDGVTQPACQDYSLVTNGLIWPQGHEITSVEESRP